MTDLLAVASSSLKIPVSQLCNLFKIYRDFFNLMQGTITLSDTFSPLVAVAETEAVTRSINKNRIASVAHLLEPFAACIQPDVSNLKVRFTQASRLIIEPESIQTSLQIDILPKYKDVRPLPSITGAQDATQFKTECIIIAKKFSWV